MAVRRSETVDDSRSGIYHCCDRCVRRYALLDSDGDRRRQWLHDRLHLLATAYAVDNVSMAVMKNHMHNILRTLPEIVATWSDREVVYRWLLIHPNRTRRRRMGIDPDVPPQEVELDLFLGQPKLVDDLRSRLSSVSWFMKDLKEPIARRANREDDAPGHFWQSRFRCEPLLDDDAILTCATYVDMNPVAAGVTEDALTAKFTSVAEHLRRLLVETDGEKWPQGGAATEEEREAFLTLLDEIEFTPAIPCRREPYLAAEETTVQACDWDRPPASSEPSSSATALGPVPHRAVLPITLGGYLRRLAAASGLTAAKRAAMSPPPGRRGDPSDGAAGVGKLAQSILDGIDRSMESLATLILEARFWGTAIGSSRNLAIEAARRGRHRIACAFR